MFICCSFSRNKIKDVAPMLRLSTPKKDLESAREKAKAVVEQKLRAMKLPEAMNKLVAGIETYTHFPREHWIKIRTNNGIERLMQEIRRRARWSAAFRDLASVIM